MLALADLKDLAEQEVKDHVATQYGQAPCGEKDLRIQKELEDFEILIAYESVGSHGCDSSSWFLLKRNDGELFEFSGSHCSCYGFEEQYDLESTSVEYLKSDRFRFYTGGYDDESEENKKAIHDYIDSL